MYLSAPLVPLLLSFASFKPDKWKQYTRLITTLSYCNIEGKSATAAAGNNPIRYSQHIKYALVPAFSRGLKIISLNTPINTF